MSQREGPTPPVPASEAAARPAATVTPRELGYQMPAEWKPHEATWITWPQRAMPEAGLERAVCTAYARIVKELSRGEEIRIIVNDSAAETSAREILERESALSPRVTFHYIPTNCECVRDYGPIFLRRDRNDKPLAAADFTFNSWGQRKPPWNDDNEIPKRLAAQLGIPIFTPDIVLEAGSIEVNGRGLLLATEACLLNFNRNPSLSAAQVERYLCDWIGVERVLWLGDGIRGDDKDGHIDNIARFINEDTVVAVVEENSSDPNRKTLRENLARLMRMHDLAGNRLSIETLPMPEPVMRDGNRMPASYASFYIGNECVLVPTFKCPQDEIALKTLEILFPGRRIVGIESGQLVSGAGGFHSLTTQQPLVGRGS